MGRHRGNPDCRAPAIFGAGCVCNPLRKHANSRMQLTTFNKGLHTLPMTKKAGTPQSGFPLCLPITAVIFRTQLNSKDFLFLLQLYHTKQDVTTLSNQMEMC